MNYSKVTSPKSRIPRGLSYGDTSSYFLDGVRDPNMRDKRQRPPKWNTTVRNLKSLRRLSRVNIFASDVQVFENLAEVQALYPDTELTMDCSVRGTRIRSSRDVLSILCFLVDNNYQKTSGGLLLLERFQDLAHKNHYDGEWKVISSLLRVSGQWEMFWQRFKQNRSKEEFFGNFLPRGKRLSKQLYLEIFDLSPVLNPEFRRGYKDKGSSRSPEMHHGEEIPGKTKRETTENISSDRLIASERTAQFNFLWNNKSVVEIVEKDPEEELWKTGYKVRRIFEQTIGRTPSREEILDLVPFYDQDPLGLFVNKLEEYRNPEQE